MKKLPVILAIPLLALYFAIIVFSLVSIGCGLYLAFKASIALGVIVLILEPSASIIGTVYLLTGTDLAQKIMEWLTKQ